MVNSPHAIRKQSSMLVRTHVGAEHKERRVDRFGVDQILQHDSRVALHDSVCGFMHKRFLREQTRKLAVEDPKEHVRAVSAKQHVDLHATRTVAIDYILRSLQSLVGEWLRTKRKRMKTK
ncbi:hypothetical protein FI667_g10588, partial [Globisporangium splendens]